MMTVRTTTLDGHLGDSLFRLNVVVHFEIAKKRGWLDRPEYSPGERATNLWEGVSEPGKGPRRYQCSISQGSNHWILFAPSGTRNDYFLYYASRINAVGWRRHFPSGSELEGIDLRKTVVDANKEMVSLHCCNLAEAELTAGQVFVTVTEARGLRVGSRSRSLASLAARECNFEQADLSLALDPEIPCSFESCILKWAGLNYANLGIARFRNSPTNSASFWGSRIDRADFDEVSLPTLDPP
jgi:hypothetical protein